MRAWRVHELGDPADVLKLDDVDEPAPGPGQVVIAVEACGINFPDVLQCQGKYQVRPPMPFTPGMEAAGPVLAVGAGVDHMKEGQRVVVLASPPHGALAEQVAVSAFSALPLPDAMPAAKAACLPVNYHTGWFALKDRARLQPGESLLVHAGAGGVGSAAIQLGLAIGARVFATAGGPEKVEICRKLGAELVIDYTETDFVDPVKEATGGAGVDVVYDPVGGDVFDRSRRAIAWDGRLLVIGFTSGRIPEAPANHILLKNYSIVGVHWAASVGRNPGSLARVHGELMRLYEDGGIDPLVFREVPMDEAPAALEVLAHRGTYGKVIVRP